MNTRLVIVGFAALLWATSVQARLTATAKCEATQNQVAGKYSFCVQKAQAKLIKTKGTCSTTSTKVCYRDDECPSGETCTKDLTKYNDALTKCEEKFAENWQKAIDKATAAGATCPTSSDQGTVQTDVTHFTTCLNTDLGGTPGTCDVTTLQSDLGACTAGTAAVGDVLSGKTFSSGSGLGLTGTVPAGSNVNGLNGSKTFTIPDGLYSGSKTATANDTNLVPDKIVSGVTIFGVTGAQPPSQPLKTGQTQCDQGAGLLGPCPGSPAGQDGDWHTGMARSYTDNGNGTITDNSTGLIWEKLDDNNASGIHDKDANFNWYNAFKKIQVLNGDATGCIAAGNPDICCTGTGTGSCSPFAGQTDWRLPNRFELESLFDLAAWSSPAVDPAFNTNCSAGCTVDGSVPPMCSCTLSGAYWTSTTSLSTTACGGSLYCNAYDVEFNSGAIQPNKLKSSNLFYVRAVRGGL